MQIPYTYLIGWSKYNKFYYGARYSKVASPDDLWTTYFTSSKVVAKFVADFGKPDIIQVRRTFKTVNDCLRWENRVLKRFMYDQRFLNLRCNFNGKSICTKGMVVVTEDGINHFTVPVDHPLYTSGVYRNVSKGKVIVVDHNGKRFKVYATDPRFISGELKHMNKGNRPPTHTGKIWVTNGTNNRLILPESLHQFEVLGFKRGKRQK